MNIGILTYHHCDNYGAVLQAYGLQKVIKNMGHTVEFINRRPRQSLKSNIRKLVSFFYTLSNGHYKNAHSKHLAFENFRKEHLSITRPYWDVSEFRKDVGKYDAIIVGSDQVWNVGGLLNCIDPFFFLNLDSQIAFRRISYGACFGIKEQPHSLKKEIGELLRRFNHLSVRNKFSQDIVREFSGCQAELVVDPTLLTSFEEIVDHTKEENYILVYSLKRITAYQISKIVEEVRKVKASKVISLSSKVHYPFANEYVMDAGPGKFLSLIRGASFVVTDSFHGTIFSIKYRKPFITPIHGSYTYRIADVLEKYDLMDHLVSSSDQMQDRKLVKNNIDYDHVHSMIAKDIENSMKYIDTVLS